MEGDDNGALGSFVTGTFDSEECPVKRCDEERYSTIGMEFHLMRDHR